jgi:hypothetical protein
MASRVALLAAVLASPALAQTDPYQLTPPSGWTRTEESGALVLTPPGSDAESARIIVLPPKPLEADFEAQAARERAAVEGTLGLRDARSAAPKVGRTDAGLHVSYYATYSTDSGDRYAGFYSLADKGAFALAVFYATTRDAFGRLESPANTVFWGLRIRPGAASLAGAAGEAAQDAPSPAGGPGLPAAPAPGGDLRSRLVGTFTTFQAPADVRDLTSKLVQGAGPGVWWRFRDDGTYRHATRTAISATAWRGEVDDGRWTLEGDVLTVQKDSGGPITRLDVPPVPPAKKAMVPPVTYRVSFGPKGELLLAGESGTIRLPPAR